ncbi:MAG: phosphomethylpyrimidine synthase ThiC [Desulfobacterales bacterium]
MIEGPGHVPLSRIAGDMKTQKRVCGGAPYYVLGPLPTDIAAGYDHITGAIGGGHCRGQWRGFSLLCHPGGTFVSAYMEDVREGGYCLKNRGAYRGFGKRPGICLGPGPENVRGPEPVFDWQTMFAVCIDPEKAKKMRLRSEDQGPGRVHHVPGYVRNKPMPGRFQKTNEIDELIKVQILCCAASLAASAYAEYASLLRICAPQNWAFSLPSKFDF